MKQKLKVRLIRHGEKRLFMPDPWLTDLGREQAANLAQQLKAKLAAIAPKKVLVLASPKRRTQETATFIGQALGLDVQTDDFLNLNYLLSENLAGKNAWLKHFQELATDGVEEIIAVTHSQNIRNYWRVLGGPEKMIADIVECGCWTVEVDGEKMEFSL